MRYIKVKENIADVNVNSQVHSHLIVSTSLFSYISHLSRSVLGLEVINSGMIFISSVNICFVTALQGSVVHVSAIATNIISTEQLSAEMHELIFLLSTHI